VSQRAYAVGKRSLDVVVAGGVLLLTSPVQAATAAAVRMQMGSPVLFRQRRPGLDGASFTIVKFRTMRQSEGADPSTDGQRITRLGSVLRSTSLDELPTLWNVIRGEMSLVGPRPLLEQYLERYSPTQARRHEVRPGLTGLAQVEGRNALTWDEKLGLDVSYVDHASLRLDLWILWRTVRLVLTRHGVAADGSASMPEFMGSSSTAAQA